MSFADPVFENEGGGRGWRSHTRRAYRACPHVRGQGAISIPRLPGTADEVREIAKILGGSNEIFRREQAQEKTAQDLQTSRPRVTCISPRMASWAVSSCR